MSSQEALRFSRATHARFRIKTPRRHRSRPISRLLHRPSEMASMRLRNNEIRTPIMFKSLVPLSSERHRATRLRQNRSWAFAAQQVIVSIVGSEAARTATEFPLAFTANGDEFVLSAVLGVEQGRNLFVTPTGQWIANYVPALFRQYPFAQGRSPDGGQNFLCIDEDCGLLSEQEGTPLFKPDGSPDEVLATAIQLMNELHRVSELQRQPFALLARHELIVPWNPTVEVDGKARVLEGLFRIDETRLNALPDETFLELRKCGVLALAYAQLLSMGKLTQLVELVKLHGRLAPQKSVPTTDAADGLDYANTTFDFNF